MLASYHPTERFSARLYTVETWKSTELLIHKRRGNILAYSFLKYNII